MSKAVSFCIFTPPQDIRLQRLSRLFSFYNQTLTPKWIALASHYRDEDYNRFMLAMESLLHHGGGFLDIIEEYLESCPRADKLLSVSQIIFRLNSILSIELLHKIIVLKNPTLVFYALKKLPLDVDLLNDFFEAVKNGYLLDIEVAAEKSEKIAKLKTKVEKLQSRQSEFFQKAAESALSGHKKRIEALQAELATLTTETFQVTRV